jgi:hypothetical protein
VLAATARALDQAGRADKARKLAHHALSASRKPTKGFDPIEFQYIGLGELARSLLDIGERDEALSIVDRILVAGHHNELVQAGIAPVLAYAGEHERALKLLAKSPPYVTNDDVLREIAPLAIRDGHGTTLKDAVPEYAFFRMLADFASSHLSASSF